MFAASHVQYERTTFLSTSFTSWYNGITVFLHTSCYLTVILTNVFVLACGISTARNPRIKQFQFTNYFIYMSILFDLGI